MIYALINPCAPRGTKQLPFKATRRRSSAKGQETVQKFHKLQKTYRASDWETGPAAKMKVEIKLKAASRKHMRRRKTIAKSGKTGDICAKYISCQNKARRVAAGCDVRSRRHRKSYKRDRGEKHVDWELCAHEHLCDAHASDMGGSSRF